MMQLSKPLHASPSSTHAPGLPAHWLAKQIPLSGQASQLSHSGPKGQPVPTPAGLPVNWQTLTSAAVSSSLAATQLCEPSW